MYIKVLLPALFKLGALYSWPEKLKGYLGMVYGVFLEGIRGLYVVLIRTLECVG